MKSIFARLALFGANLLHPRGQDDNAILAARGFDDINEEPYDLPWGGGFVFPREYPTTVQVGETATLKWNTNFTSHVVYIHQRLGSSLKLTTDAKGQSYKWKVARITQEDDPHEPYLLRVYESIDGKANTNGFAFDSPSFWFGADGKNVTIVKSSTPTPEPTEFESTVVITSVFKVTRSKSNSSAPIATTGASNNSSSTPATAGATTTRPVASPTDNDIFTQAPAATGTQGTGEPGAGVRSAAAGFLSIALILPVALLVLV
ncbi:hypothetical protein BU24DRAFT_410063 [Aaosphaeria arxii CBS 175.79]|uniref:Uncharacterized protein n=1 Tax=Aaosphaeria arxii CBS 175.79 TaxID=1450172 RepID=A0A6A5XN49_9PLEO|nr:uncharacterized protein BU24DRAFT_410063 [Aaosphaeria arxii CBS 175.79]KAF2014309.1 hypothetical protein BU24DRAFT_410063 [Aaosphaeria arxii CBS 175.79]